MVRASMVWGPLIPEWLCQRVEGFAGSQRRGHHITMITAGGKRRGARAASSTSRRYGGPWHDDEIVRHEVFGLVVG
jgi:hypothetical protein